MHGSLGVLGLMRSLTINPRAPCFPALLPQRPANRRLGTRQHTVRKRSSSTHAVVSMSAFSSSVVIESIRVALPFFIFFRACFISCRVMHNVFVTSYTSLRLPYLAASSASLASAFAHFLLSALKLLFTSLFFSFYSILLLSLILSDLVSPIFFFNFLLSSILLQLVALIQVLLFLCL